MHKTFVVNLAKRKDRRKHTISQFRNRKEFSIKIITAMERDSGALGLWETFRFILSNEGVLEEDFFIFCEDDHLFTNAYNRDLLESSIMNAVNFNADVLVGGVSWFDTAIQVKDNLFWLDKFSGMQFTVIFKRFFKIILNYKYFEKKDTLDRVICKLSDKKFVIFPMISIQKEFGYSDVTNNNNVNGRVNFLFSETNKRLTILKNVSDYYNKFS